SGSIQALHVRATEAEGLGGARQRRPDHVRVSMSSDQRGVQVDVDTGAAPDPTVRIVVAKLEPQLSELGLGRGHGLPGDQDVDVVVGPDAVVELGERRSLEQHAVHPRHPERAHNAGGSAFESQPARGDQSHSVVRRCAHQYWEIVPARRDWSSARPKHHTPIGSPITANTMSATASPPQPPPSKIAERSPSYANRVGTTDPIACSQGGRTAIGKKAPLTRPIA